MSDGRHALRVLVPMKPLGLAKTRLWTDLPEPERRGVTLMMMDRVVRAAVGVLGRGACHVVGGDATVRAAAEAAGARWDADPGSDLNSSLGVAMRRAYDDGCAAALFLPGDLPQADEEDVVALIEASDGYTRPVGVRAARDGGTNALLVPAACAFEPQLGRDSFARHLAAAERSGAPLQVAERPRLAFDVDSADDLRWARDHVSGFWEEVGSWRRWLEEKEV